MTYKAGEAFATGMLRPFLLDAGLGLADIGWLVGSVGSVAGLGGALLGGALVGRLGVKAALVIFGALQALTVVGYAWVALASPSLLRLYAVCAAEHLASGMATAALFTCMMGRCAGLSAATDYTVQASAVVVATALMAALSGYSAQALGYAGHFAVAAALAATAVVAAVRWCEPAKGA